MSLRHISFRRLGTSDVHIHYLEEDPALAPYLGLRPRNTKDLLARAPLDARRILSGSELGNALLAYAERHQAPPEAMANARAMADGTPTAVVVTGQQPGLFGGPMYTLHKAATAVRLARQLAATPGSPRVVPVFWNHTDDHDLDEVNRAFFANANHEVQRLRLDVPRTGEAIRGIGVGRALDALLADLEPLLPEGEFRAWTMDVLRSRQPDEHLGDGMARLLFALFGAMGLLVIEPRDLPDPAFVVLERWWRQAPAIRAEIRSATEHLQDRGLDIALDPGATLMFQLSGKRRIGLADGEELPSALTDLSPGVLLRPLWQDACLPSIASVVGPGELAYMALAGPLYRLLGVPQPRLVPRASLTLVQPSLQKLLDKFGWDIPDLADGVDALTGRLLGSADRSPTERELRDLALLLGRRCDEILAQVRESGDRSEQQIAGSLEKLRSKLADDLTRLADRLARTSADQQGAGARQIRRLCAHLRPRGRPQERVLTVLPAMVVHGPALGEILVAAADPFAVEHGVLEL